ncbi:hypothetical protein PV11_02448 [Exophiala sideris]|uniref:C2H2-type domain-containing protein n=1 Tax=Exophiala sideris TaxID=1016849 RepID=A0A0D1YWC3_9EURO|nr:hypothetical protein PV11_02448 [Exophiala sideris]
MLPYSQSSEGCVTMASASASSAFCDATSSSAFDPVLSCSSNLDPNCTDSYALPVGDEEVLLQPTNAPVHRWHGSLFPSPVSSYTPLTSPTSAPQPCFSGFPFLLVHPEAWAQPFPTAYLATWQYPQNYDECSFSMAQPQTGTEDTRGCDISAQSTRSYEVDQNGGRKHWGSDDLLLPDHGYNILPSVSTGMPLANEVDVIAVARHPGGQIWDITKAGTLCSTAGQPPGLECPSMGQDITALQSQSSANLDQRMHEHADQHVCPLCGKAFPEKNQLGNHKKSHEGPFACTVCPKVFPKRAALSSHLRTHDPLRRTVKCTVEGCGKQYRRGGCLNRHVKSAHQSGDTYACQYCKRTFRRSDLRDRHEKDHCHVRQQLERTGTATTLPP